MSSALLTNYTHLNAHPNAHLTPANADGWAFWQLAECRTAGLPVQTVFKLANPACAQAADQAARAQQQLAQAWEALRKEVKSGIRELLKQVAEFSAENATENLPAQLASLQQEISALRLAAKAIDRQQCNAALQAVAPPQVLEELQQRQAEAAALHAAYLSSFAQASLASMAAIGELAAQPWLREAVTWQNAQVVPMLFPILQDPSAAGNSKWRRSEELLASYVQRYSCKNDTIGFFGPVGWAKFGPQAQSLHLTKAAPLLRQRHLYFEDWAVQALAAQLSTQAALRPWQTPRRMPYLRLDGASLHFPAGEKIQLDAESAALLAACQGIHTAQQIAQALLANPFLDFLDEEDIYQRLEQLLQAQRISWGFVVRVGDAWPERYLQQQLQAIDEPVLQQNAIATLEALLQARQQLADAAGAPEALAQASTQLNTTFAAICHSAATRRAGETYGARTVAYEDCVRNMDLALGAPVLAALQPALALILQSARWYCHQLAKLFEQALQEIFMRQAARQGSATLDFPSFWGQAQDLFFSATPLDTTALDAALYQHWREILALPQAESGQALHYQSSALRAQVMARFAAPDCGWRGALHQSPDVMLAAADAAAFAAGEYQFVLGEVHMGINTLMVHSALNQHPDSQQVLQMMAQDRAAPRIIALLSRDGTQQPIRVQSVAQVGYDMELCFAHDAQPLHPASALNIGDLQLYLQDGKLRVRSVDARHDFALLDVFGDFLSTFAAARFKLQAASQHTPRMVIDRLVIARQSWRFNHAALQELPFLAAAQLPKTTPMQVAEAEIFLAVRSWRLQQQLPRCVFVKASWEKKPYFLDFDSPLYVRMWFKQIRQALREASASAAAHPSNAIKLSMSLSEMLPLAEECWLDDVQGQRYTSELRIVAVQHSDLLNSDFSRQTSANQESC